MVDYGNIIARALDHLTERSLPDRDRVAATLASVIPGIAAASWMVMAVINGALAQGVLARFGVAWRPSPDLANLGLPRWMTAALGGAALVTLLGEPWRFLGINLMIALSVPFCLGGLAVLPGVRSVAEQGYPGFETSQWYGLIGPARMSDAVVKRLAEEAAKAVAACRYPPVGMRSSGPVRAVHYGGADYVAHANDEIVVMAMIETKEGLANLDAICATPGLDAVYIGPADLSFALGLAPRGDNPDPLHLATCDKILAAAHKAGIKCVMHCAGAAFAAGAVKRGFDMVMLTSDLSCMIAGARMQLDELKAKKA